MRPDHIPQGHPCAKCGVSAFSHRPEHKPIGNPCAYCGLPAISHRTSRVRNETYKKRHCYKLKHKNECKEERDEETLYVGIDGEGQGRAFHRYVMLGAATMGGEEWTVENSDGLTTKEALDFLLNLPLPSRRVKIFAYSFNYDLTKILTDLDNESLYKLFRPELRQRLGLDARKGPWPIRWQGYRINLQGTKFTVAKGGKRRVVWDLFKFYQSKFVSALQSWNVGNKALWDRMTVMKDKRSEFDKMALDAVRAYMLEECRCLAELGVKLIRAHDDAGLKLKSFYGAGSSGAAILEKMEIRPKLVPPPEEMSEAVAAAFFGGRFENSCIGTIRDRVYNRDISSAYPYHLTFLPCLLHGRWERTRDRRKVDARSLVRYSLEFCSTTQSWAPFPFRTPDGSICFPNGSGGGWVWGDEYLSGERHFSGVVFKEAWIYIQTCECQPFAQMPHFYRERCRIGKEGAGIVLKLGPNSVYGKLAQSVGSALYQSWIWAGMITSGCRAQALEGIGRHADRANVLMVATDGLFSREDVDFPKPRDTGTEQTGKPLGGWERDVIDKGIFLARPGIYFPLAPTESELKKVRGRGVGKAAVLENWEKIISSWDKYGLSRSVKVANVTRFCGAKSSISRSGVEGSYKYKRANGKGSEPAYGQWIKRIVDMSFDPMPKRECINSDGVTLKLRTMPSHMTSVPYGKAQMSQDAKALAIATVEMLEQPDIDLTDYESE